MSTKNFVSYGDAETLFTSVGNKISGKQAKPTTISYADWLLLTPQQQETGNWLVTGVPGADLSLRVLALETNKQDKTDNNLQTTSKETTGAINELKSGLIAIKNRFAVNCGAGAFTKTVDLSEYFPADVDSKTIIVSCTSDMDVDNLTGFMIGYLNPHKGYIVTKTQTIIDFAFSGKVLTISSAAGFAYGVTATIMVL